MLNVIAGVMLAVAFLGLCKSQKLKTFDLKIYNNEKSHYLCLFCLKQCFRSVDCECLSICEFHVYIYIYVYTVDIYVISYPN